MMIDGVVCKQVLNLNFKKIMIEKIISTNISDNTTTDWTEVIEPKNNWLDLHLGELWRYRDLIMLFVWRDFVSVYKQTILGPLWHIIQPVQIGRAHV